jgi:hypothetical protein
MNVGLGVLVEVVAFAAAAYVVIEVRPRRPRLTTDAILAVIGAAMGIGALLFQADVGLVAGVVAPVFAAALLVAHVRALEATGVRLPAWVQIPTPGRLRAYANAPMSRTIEEPVQQPRPTTPAEPLSAAEPETDIDTEMEIDSDLPDLDELAPPLDPIEPQQAWPQTVVGPRPATRLPRRGARRTRVEIRRLSPLSVMKFSLIFYFCIFLVIYLALAIIWAILSASGVVDSFEQLLGTVFPSGTGISPTGEVSTGGAPPLEIDTGQLFTWLFFAGCIGVAIWSFINVFIAVMYNLISDIVGGVEVTLADRRD